MQETPVLVIIEVVSVQDPVGMKVYRERASELIGPLGGVMLGHGGTSVDGELGFAPLAIQRWPSEGAFRAWLASEAYQPLRQIRIASATVRVAVADEKNVGGASVVNHGEVDQETFLHPQLEGVQQLFPAA